LTDTTELLAILWLKSTTTAITDPIADLTALSQNHQLDPSDEEITEVARLLGEDDIGMYIVTLNFMGHPHLSWNFLIDAVRFAKTDEHLQHAAAGTAEHLLAHYGSLIDLFESQAARDPKFARMLTGVWRHRMSDAVWERLRALQRQVPDPLDNLIPFDVDTSEGLSESDRATDDKGPYRIQADGQWARSPRRTTS